MHILTKPISLLIIQWKWADPAFVPWQVLSFSSPPRQQLQKKYDVPSLMTLLQISLVIKVIPKTSFFIYYSSSTKTHSMCCISDKSVSINYKNLKGPQPNRETFYVQDTLSRQTTWWMTGSRSIVFQLEWSQPGQRKWLLLYHSSS